MQDSFYIIVANTRLWVLALWRSTQDGILHDFTASSRYDDSSHYLVPMQYGILIITAPCNCPSQLRVPYSSPGLWASSVTERVGLENRAMQISVVESRRFIINAHHGLATKIVSSVM